MKKVCLFAKRLVRLVFLIFVTGLIFQANLLQAQAEDPQKTGSTYYNLKTRNIAGNTVHIFNLEKKSKKEALNRQYPEEIYTAYFFETLNFNSLFPEDASSDIPNIDLTNILFLSGPHDFDITIKKEDIPPEILELIGKQWGEWEDIPIKNSTTFKGCLDIAKNIDIRKTFETIGVQFHPYTVTGTLGVDPIDLLKKRTTYLKDAFLKGLSLQIDLNPPSLPAVKGFFGFKSLKLGLSSGIYNAPPWNRLPAAVTEGRKKNQINLYLAGGAWLKTWKDTKELDTLIDITHKTDGNKLTILNIAEEKFDLGEKFIIPLDFEDYSGYRLELSKSKSESHPLEAELTGFAAVQFHGKAIDVIVEFDLQSDTEKPTLKYVEFDDEILLSDIVGNRLTGKVSDTLLKLGLNKLRIQPDGFEAKATLFGQPADVFFFEYGDDLDKGINLAFGLENNLSLDKLSLTGSHGAGPSSLKNITLPATLFFYSEKGIKTTRKKIKNGILRHLCDKFYTYPDDTLVMNGVGFLSKFDKSHFGKIGEAATKLGAKDDAMILADMAGVFDNRPFALNLYLTADLRKSSIQALAGKVLSIPKDTIPRVHIGIMKDEVAIGVGVELNLGSRGGLPGSLGGEIQVDLDDNGLGLNFVGNLGEWKHPFGIPTITLKDVMFEFAVDDEATLKPGFGSTVNYLGKDVEVDGSLRLEVGDGGFPLPTGVAFKGAIDSLDSETWVYVDDLIVLIIVVAVLALIVGGGAFLLIGLFTGGTAWIVTGAIGGAAGLAALALFTNVAGPAITAAVIGDIVIENIAHPQKLKNTLQDVKKFDVGDGVKQLVDAVVIPVKKDFKTADKAFAALEAKIITMKDAYLSLATPGAEDAGNNIPEGLYVHGEAYLFNSIHLGSQSHKVYNENNEKDSSRTVSAEKSLKTETPSSRQTESTGGHVNNFQLGPLHFNGNTLYTRPDPLGIASEVEIFGVQEKVTIKFDDGLYFDATIKLGDLGDVETTFKYDEANKDFTILADLHSTIAPKLEQEVIKGINEIIQSAHLSSQQVSSDLKQAKADVQTAQKLAAEEMQKVTDQIEKDPTVRSLENQVNRAIDYAEHGVYGEIDSLCKKTCCHSTFHHSWCVGEDKCKSGLDWMAKKAGHAVGELKSKLDTAKSNVQIPKALSDAVNRANQDLKGKTGILNQIQSLSDNITGVKGFLDNLDTEINKTLKAGFIRVNEAILAGKMADLQKGLPLVLEVKYTLNGKDRIDYFGFNPGDASYNAKSLALLPVMVLDDFIHNINDPATSYLTNWLMALVNAQLTHITNDVEKQLMLEEKQYEKIIETYLQNQKALALYRTDFKVDLSKTSSTYSQTDLMPPSKQFKNQYLAVGHSALCLGVASNGVDVYQENCKDIESERWTTQDLNNGYVQLRSKGLCLKARTQENTETEPLILARCDSNDVHEQWKVLSSDGFFDKIVNRFSEKCLHFDIENANPKTAYATWSSCLGMDSQTFREIGDAERPTWHNVRERIKAANNTCLATNTEFADYFKESAKGHPTTTKSAYDQMKQKQHDVLISGACTQDNENTFNYVEMVNGDIKLVHDRSGWCVAPQSQNGSNLVLMPCNKNKNLLWENRRKGDGFAIENSYLSNKCITLEPIPEHRVNGRAAIEQCRNDDTQDMRFSK